MRSIFGFVVLASVITAGCASSSNQPPPTTTGASTPIHVAIAIDGTTTFDGKKADGAALTTYSREATQTRAPLVLIVDAEREVSWQVVMSTVERIRAGGATNVLLGTILASSQPNGAPATAASTPTTSSAAAFVAAAGAAKGPTPQPHAAPAAGTKWDCAFPPASDRKEATVLVRVHVESDGKPISVDVLDDPGGGFAAAAKACALEKAYQPPKDVNGKPLRSATFPFYIQFVTK